MTRTEFLNAYCDLKKTQRGSVAAAAEFQAHTRDRAEAASVWRQQKARLQNLTPDAWLKQQAKQREG